MLLSGWSAEGSALCGARRGSAPGPRSCADGAGALPLDPGPARTAPGLCPWTPRLRGGRQRDSSLWTPFFACGRDGGPFTFI
ncbi:hypothetical protein D7X33_19255 [Butyricicoccus sp. 1XD8-22]|nr:hypothetical protein D7X33_19255 [Butyricicoccus sp. 1XD8-22]